MSVEVVPAATAPRSTVDVVISAVLLALAVPLALVATSTGFFLVMASDSCGITTECSVSQITAGVGVAVVGPWVGLLGLGVWAVVRLVRRRRAWWVALLALLSVPLALTAGAALVFTSAPF